MLFHIIPMQDWEQTQREGKYQPASLAKEGFIHCSTAAQVCATANRFFRNQSDLLLLAIDASRVEATILFENLEGGQEQFPHIYGTLSLDAVVAAIPFPALDDGTFHLPQQATDLLLEEQSQKRIYVLIPAFNERDHVGGVVAAAARHLPVLVVDDGSRDDTVEVAKAGGAFAVISQFPNQGKGAALMNGFRQALARGAIAIIMLDADGQHDPDEIPLFLDRYRRETVDLIIGEREFAYMPWLRRNTNTIGRRMFSQALGVAVRDNQSGYRLVSARLMEMMLNSRETNFEFEVEMIVVCVLGGMSMDGVPIKTIYADERSHIKPLRHGYHFVRMCWQTYLRRRRQAHM